MVFTQSCGFVLGASLGLQIRSLRCRVLVCHAADTASLATCFLFGKLLGVAITILDAIDADTEPARVARLFDILIWFPGIEILDFATELRRRLDAHDARTLQYVSLMDAGVPDADDPLCWMIQAFPELAGLA